MAATVGRELRLIALDKNVVNYSTRKILEALPALNIEVAKKPEWKVPDPKTDNIAPFDLYSNQAEKRKLVLLRKRLGGPSVPPISIRKLKIKTMEIAGRPEDMLKILRISTGRKSDGVSAYPLLLPIT